MAGGPVRKRETHIASEQRRRQHIKDGFRRLSEQLVWNDDAGPQAQRSEVAILQRSIEFIKELLEEQEQLEGQLHAQGKSLDSIALVPSVKEESSSGSSVSDGAGGDGGS
ncbi:hypothetical protein HDU83_002250 [Entophlyctis luteolus]|nr:hypothetical protein HDU82_003065 [Entophlyctis luteolus]KAJ3355965.1 hypothetical protein HDU83_002250 [Entophlyctis luteolus]KAJ3391169.1 hypothetical protein HDU84_006383 [Entophlyctis sp. JEL0112]